MPAISGPRVPASSGSSADPIGQTEPPRSCYPRAGHVKLRGAVPAADWRSTAVARRRGDFTNRLGSHRRTSCQFHSAPKHESCTIGNACAIAKTMPLPMPIAPDPSTSRSSAGISAIVLDESSVARTARDRRPWNARSRGGVPRNRRQAVSNRLRVGWPRIAALVAARRTVVGLTGSRSGDSPRSDGACRSAIESGRASDSRGSLLGSGKQHGRTMADATTQDRSCCPR